MGILFPKPNPRWEQRWSSEENGRRLHELLQKMGNPSNGPDIPRSMKRGKIAHDGEFSNWAGNVRNVPAKMFWPETIRDIQAILSLARRANPRPRVRCTGSRHSWSPIVGDDDAWILNMLRMRDISWSPEVKPDQVHIDVLNIIEYPGENTAEKESTKLYVGNSSTRSPFLAEELEMINSGKPVLDDAGGLDALGLHEITVGPGVTTGDLATFLDAKNRGVWRGMYTPANVILESVTYGGIINSGCHGTGKTQTIPDYVLATSIITWEGKRVDLSKADDPKGFALKILHFGLIGVTVGAILAKGT